MTDNNFKPGPEHGGQVLTPEDLMALEENNRLIQEHNLRRAERINAAMAAQAHAQRQAAGNGQQEPQEQPQEQPQEPKDGDRAEPQIPPQPGAPRLHAIAPPPEDNALVEWLRGGTFWLALGLFGGVAIAYLMVSRAEDEEPAGEDAKSS